MVGIDEGQHHHLVGTLGDPTKIACVKASAQSTPIPHVPARRCALTVGSGGILYERSGSVGCLGGRRAEHQVIFTPIREHVS